MSTRIARWFGLFALIAGIAMAASARASSPPAGAPPKIGLALFADRDRYGAGEVARIAARIDIPRGWHVNSHWPTFDYLIPTTLRLTGPGVEVIEIRYPPGEMKAFAFTSDQELSIYEGDVAVIATVSVSAQTRASVPVTGTVSYQACSDRVCLPPTRIGRSLALALGPDGKPANQAAFASKREPDDSLTRIVGWVSGIMLLAIGLWLGRRRRPEDDDPR